MNTPDSPSTKEPESLLSEKTLVVNKLYIPIHVISVRRAITLLYKEKAEVIVVKNEQFLNYSFDDWVENRNTFSGNGSDSYIQTPSLKMKPPRIIRLLYYEDWQTSKIHLTRKNIFTRDHYRCQYCKQQKPKNQLSLDHVIPLSRGGKTTWNNVVTACRDCNIRKGGRLLKNTDMSLLKQPQSPSIHPVIQRKLQEDKYQSWKTFLDDTPSAVQVR